MRPKVVRICGYVRGVDDVQERCRRTRLLLATADDPYPRPRDSLGSLEGRVDGPAPGRRVPCGICLRTGHVAGARTLCPGCGGSGWRRRAKGEDAWDEYTGEPVAGDGSSRAHKVPFRLEDDYRKLGEQLDRVNRSIAEREGIFTDAYAWERARVVWDRLGSYRELRVALTALKDAWPTGYSVIRAVWIMDLPVKMIGSAHRVEDEAVSWIAVKMPDEIRVPPWLLEDAKAHRVKTVADYVSEGKTAGEIARVLNVSKKKVQRLMKGMNAPRSA